MATEDSVRQLDHFNAPGMTSVPIRTNGVEAAGQDWIAGSPLIRSSGKLAEGAEDLTANVIGFASSDASGTTDHAVSYIPAVPGIEFEATLENGSTGDHALAQTDMDVAYGLAVTAAGLWYIDQAETSNIACVVVAFVDPIGTVQGRVRARLLDTVSIYND